MDINKLAAKIDELASTIDRLFQEFETAIEGKDFEVQREIFKSVLAQLVDATKLRIAAVQEYRFEIERGMDNFKILASRERFSRKKHERNIRKLSGVLADLDLIMSGIENNIDYLNGLMETYGVDYKGMVS